jgi:hypothetical protein
VTVVADERLRGLVAAPDGSEGSLTVVFGETAAPPDADEVVRFTHVGDGSSGRVVAPAGDGLWSRSPWPAADALFELPEPSAEAGILVAGGADPERAALVTALEERGLDAESAAELSLAGLEAAGAVVLPAAGEALPALAPAVLAAGRLLLTRPARPDFGFVAGIHRLEFTGADEAADHLESARRLPHAYRAMAAWGRAAAERHRASAVYGRLVTELALASASR